MCTTMKGTSSIAFQQSNWNCCASTAIFSRLYFYWLLALSRIRFIMTSSAGCVAVLISIIRANSLVYDFRTHLTYSYNAVKTLNKVFQNTKPFGGVPFPYHVFNKILSEYTGCLNKNVPTFGKICHILYFQS